MQRREGEFTSITCRVERGDGKMDDKMPLARARSEAVAAELVSAHGIAGARLKGYGVGTLAPMASNDDAGRAKNRRVQRVRQP